MTQGMRKRKETPAAADQPFRWLIGRDMAEVRDIDIDCFDIPWTDLRFRETLRDRKTIGMIYELEGRIRGYLIYTLERKHIRILRFAVDREDQRKGIGRKMLARVQNKLRQQHRNRIEIAVPETLLGAHLMLKACGFLGTHVTPGDEERDPDNYEFIYREPEDEEMECEGK